MIHQYREPAVAEKVSAKYLTDLLYQDQFQKSLVPVFDDFQSKYPQNHYIGDLKVKVDKIAKYYEKIAGAMPAGVKFIDGETIGTLEQLLTEIKGDKYYIDLNPSSKETIIPFCNNQ